MFTTSEHTWMTHALALAARGLNTTDPNPRVGCVLVKDDERVGEGWHQQAGSAHAEIMALSQAGEHARGATSYVTLEPCAHAGRTAPCVKALVEAGVARVVIAMTDPNPLTHQQGIQQLRQAGVEVEVGLLEAEARALNPGFISRMTRGRPWTRLKMAMSLDGRTAMASGESQWITGEAAREEVAQWRGRSSAILTGINTVLADNPQLNARIEIPPEAQPIKVVLDSQWRMPQDVKLLETGVTWVVGATAEAQKQQQLKAAGAETFICNDSQSTSRIDLPKLFQLFNERELNEIWVEAGPTLSGALLQAGLVDELVLYMAPKILGSQARGLFDLPGLTALQQAYQCRIESVTPVGEDWRLLCRFDRG